MIRIIRSFSDKINISQKNKIYNYSKELIGSLKPQDIAVYSYENEIDENTSEKIRLITRIYNAGAYLYIEHPNPYSTAFLVDNKLAPMSEEVVMAKKDLLNTMLHDIHELSMSVTIPQEFIDLYWDYQFGRIKANEICFKLNISRTTMSKYVHNYENSVEYFVHERKIADDVICFPKQGVLRYDDIAEIIDETSHLSNQTIEEIEKAYSMTYIDAWRFLRTYIKSRFFYFREKSNGEEYKNRPIFAEIKSALELMGEYGYSEVFILLEETGFVDFSSKESIIGAYSFAKDFKNSDGNYSC